MQKTHAAIGSTAFFIAAPGTVTLLIPWLITRWESRDLLPDALSWATPALVAVGGALILAGSAVVISAFARFVVDGLGTPAPVAPPEHLVVTGLYRYVRNPMYVGVPAILIGEALLLGRWELLAYTAIVFACVYTFARFYEEPKLRSLFGHEYETYRAAVPGWWPRLRPWRP
jgi:Putative protein-S-isoprenylcysteine methyltransferase